MQSFTCEILSLQGRMVARAEVTKNYQSEFLLQLLYNPTSQASHYSGITPPYPSQDITSVAQSGIV